ncbi:hypothetical protein MKEN_00545000 [Mycena kentingensis (nom. inval.)]|nr:hypothetical protein MKEN_00545000 [Mycena kentingensis (nom. inval.)]
MPAQRAYIQLQLTHDLPSPLRPPVGSAAWPVPRELSRAQSTDGHNTTAYTAAPPAAFLVQACNKLGLGFRFPFLILGTRSGTPLYHPHCRRFAAFGFSSTPRARTSALTTPTSAASQPSASRKFHLPLKPKGPLTTSQLVPGIVWFVRLWPPRSDAVLSRTHRIGRRPTTPATTGDVEARTPNSSSVHVSAVWTSRRTNAACAAASAIWTTAKLGRERATRWIGLKTSDDVPTATTPARRRGAVGDGPADSSPRAQSIVRFATTPNWDAAAQYTKYVSRFSNASIQARIRTRDATDSWSTPRDEQRRHRR